VEVWSTYLLLYITHGTLGCMLFGIAGSCLSVEGSLSGLQLLNLISEAHKHQQVLHVGCVPPLNSQQHHLSSSGLGYYCPVSGALGNDRTSSDAFTFKFTCGPQEEAQCGQPSHGVKSVSATGNTVKLILRMASVTYLHIPHLLHELTLCVSDFRAYFMRITDSLRTAAADLAMGLVMNKHADILTAVSVYGSSWGLEVGHHGSKSDLSYHQKLEREWSASENETVGGLQFIEEENESVSDEDSAPAAGSFSFLLDAVLESPIVMLPRSPGSSEVLSLHLGKIVITNKHDLEASLQNTQDFSDAISIEIRNMSMYSADLDKLQQRQPTNAGCQSSHGVVMLHDTSVEMMLQQKRGYLDGIFAELHANIADDKSVCSTLDHLEVTGTVVTPLHIVLTKRHYEQILNTLDNITLPDDVQSSQSSTGIKQNEQVVAADAGEVIPGVSALKCDELLGMQQPLLVGTSHSASKHSSSLVVCGSFSLPSFIVQMRADFADGGIEQDIVALRLDGFEVNAVARKWIKAFDFQLQVCSVSCPFICFCEITAIVCGSYR